VSQEVTLRSVAVPAYLPALLYGTGQGAVAPVVALTARGLGASVGVAGLVVALLGVGQILGDVPAGAIAARIGERRAMLGSVVVSSVALTGCLLADRVWVLCLAVLLLGTSNSVFGLARQAFLTDVIPAHLRARALSTLGGTLRVGAFVGPFLAAPVIGVLGPAGAYVVHLVVAAVVVVVLLVVPEPEHLRHAARSGDPVPIAEVVRSNARVLRTLGVSGLLIGAVRASRQVVVPLWAQRIGLDPATTAVVYGISGVIDALLFYPSGRVMDLRGRAAVAVPSMFVLGVAHLLLPLAGSEATLIAVAIVMGIGNGMGSGVVMTLAADVSPSRGRAEFLGVWRIFHDSGMAGGPLVLSGVAGLAGLAPAALAMGGLGLVSSALLARWIPRYSPRGLLRRGGPPASGDRAGTAITGENGSPTAGAASHGTDREVP
jgi:MFS family permease